MPQKTWLSLWLLRGYNEQKTKLGEVMSREIGQVLFNQAIELAQSLPAAGVLAYREQIASFDSPEKAREKVRLVVAVRGEKGRGQAEELFGEVVVVPRANLTRQAQISLGVLASISQGFFKSGDLLVCLAGPWNEPGLDTLQVVRVREAGAALCATCQDSLHHSIASQAFNSALTLAVELAQEGREGRPIGTIFVLGDHEKVLQFSRQLVLNPFAGYPEESLSILHQEMKETIREYSSLDGAFVIRGDGVLVAAGRQLSASSMGLELPQGMGARHHAAAAITAITEAVAIVISESSGTVTVFIKGQIVASLEKARPGLESEGEA